MAFKETPAVSEVKGARLTEEEFEVLLELNISPSAFVAVFMNPSDIQRRQINHRFRTWSNLVEKVGSVRLCG